MHNLSSGSFGRVLMPPPPPLFVAPGPVARKRPREATVEDQLSLPTSTASTGMRVFHSWSFVRISVILCVFQCCLLLKWHLPPCGIGVGVETCVTLSLVEPTDLLFLYMFSVFPLFSLSTCTSWTCLLWMCAVVPFHLISPLAVDHTKSKTTANMRLLNGFPFFPLPPPLSLFSCLSIFIMPLQVFKQTNAWRSLRWLKMHQGWYLMEGIPLMKMMKGHTAVRQITHSFHPHCPGYLQTQTLIFISAVLKSQKEKSTLTS